MTWSNLPQVGTNHCRQADHRQQKLINFWCESHTIYKADLSKTNDCIVHTSLPHVLATIHSTQYSVHTAHSGSPHDDEASLPHVLATIHSTQYSVHTAHSGSPHNDEASLPHVLATIHSTQYSVHTAHSGSPHDDEESA